MALVDDSFLLHERAGQMVLAMPQVTHPLMGPITEIVFWMALGGMALAQFAWAWRETPVPIRRRLLLLAALFAGVVFCGVVVDLLHSLIPYGS